MAPLAYDANLATCIILYHLHCLIALIALLALSASIELVSSSARVTSIKFHKPLTHWRTDGHPDPKIGPQVYLGPIKTVGHVTNIRSAPVAVLITVTSLKSRLCALEMVGARDRAGDRFSRVPRELLPGRDENWSTTKWASKPRNQSSDFWGPGGWKGGGGGASNNVLHLQRSGANFECLPLTFWPIKKEAHKAR